MPRTPLRRFMTVSQRRKAHSKPAAFVDFDGSWDEAMEQAGGYDADEILTRVLRATLDVVQGRAMHERDSVTFDRITYAWPVLASLLWSAAQHDGSLRVMDIGGSLGSSYLQNRRFLARLKQVSWAVVEQPTFAAAGRSHLQDEHLSFHDSIVSASTTGPQIALLSSVLQYLDDPVETLREVSLTNVGMLILDRTPIHDGPSDRITIQHVPPSIYPASYAARILSLRALRSALADLGWEIVEEFETLERPMTTSSGFAFRWIGMACVRVGTVSNG
jgi:putative methyltransferase (TIGR04325 family)